MLSWGIKGLIEGDPIIVFVLLCGEKFPYFNCSTDPLKVTFFSFFSCFCNVQTPFWQFVSSSLHHFLLVLKIPYHHCFNSSVLFIRRVTNLFLCNWWMWKILSLPFLGKTDRRIACDLWYVLWCLDCE